MFTSFYCQWSLWQNHPSNSIWFHSDLQKLWRCKVGTYDGMFQNRNEWSEVKWGKISVMKSSEVKWNQGCEDNLYWCILHILYSYKSFKFYNGHSFALEYWKFGWWFSTIRRVEVKCSCCQTLLPRQVIDSRGWRLRDELLHCVHGWINYWCVKNELKSVIELCNVENRGNIFYHEIIECVSGSVYDSTTLEVETRCICGYLIWIENKSWKLNVLFRFFIVSADTVWMRQFWSVAKDSSDSR